MKVCTCLLSCANDVLLKCVKKIEKKNTIRTKNPNDTTFFDNIIKDVAAQQRQKAP